MSQTQAGDSATKSESKPDDVRGVLEPLPPSCKLVYKVLEYEGRELDQSEIADIAVLSQRTTRYALNRLEDDGVVVSRPKMTDLRATLYRIAGSRPTRGRSNGHGTDETTASGGVPDGD